MEFLEILKSYNIIAILQELDIFLLNEMKILFIWAILMSIMPIYTESKSYILYVIILMLENKEVSF